MTSDQYQQAKRLLDAALDLPPAAREQFLLETCEDDEVRAEVQSLLTTDDEEEEISAFFDENGAAALFGEEASASQRRIGPYELVGEIGRGGMGTVYRARRDDDQYEREVALKVVRFGWDTEVLIQRFFAERQILASLEHPHIARLYDGGLTDDGRPYFVMERIHGSAIDAYCDSRQLSIRDRLELFSKVAGAVAYAHGRLVVHRDLKPSNILVTEDGTPKLLDFGVAKLLAEDSEAPGDPPTQAELRMMTPEYAAPEQVRHGSISTATDVYALGVLLYRLLSGRRPYRIEKRTGAAIERVVCTVQPERPSLAVMQPEEDDEAPEAVADARAIKPAALSRMLRGDLDRIVLKALRKDPEQRYVSAKAFADDIQRYLHGQPVVAREPTLRYRARKFVHRNRWGVGAAMLLMLLLVGYAATVTVQSERIARERNRAQLEARKAEEVSQFLTRLFQEANPEQGPDSSMTTRDLLDFGASRISTELDGQPAVQMRLMNIIGLAYRNRGFYEEAQTLLRRALALHTEGAEVSPQALADLHNNLGEVHYYLGHYERAQQYYERSLALRRQHLGDRHLDVAQSLNNLALIDLFQDDLVSAERRMRQGLAIFEDVLDGDHWRIANARNVLAQALIAGGSLKEARTLNDSSLAMHRRLHGEDSYQLALVVALHNRGHLLRLQGDARAAEAVHREALDQFLHLLPPDHPFIGETLMRLAAAVHAQQRHDEAADLYLKALRHQQDALREGDSRQAAPMVGLAQLLLDNGCSTRARPLLRQALRIQRADLPASHRKISASEELLAAAQGQPETSQARQRRCANLIGEAGTFAASFRGEDIRGGRRR